MMNVTTFQGKSSQRKPLKSLYALCTNCMCFFSPRTLNQRFPWGLVMPAAAEQGAARSGKVPVPLCPQTAASRFGDPSPPSEAKKQSLTNIFFLLSAISPSLNYSLSCWCVYYILTFWCWTDKVTPAVGTSLLPPQQGHQTPSSAPPENRRRCSVKMGLPKSPFCPVFSSLSLSALFLLTRRSLTTALTPWGVVAMGMGRKLI